jgi:hypothetical protein
MNDNVPQPTKEVELEVRVYGLPARLTLKVPHWVGQVQVVGSPEQSKLVFSSLTSDQHIDVGLDTEHYPALSDARLLPPEPDAGRLMSRAGDWGLVFMVVALVIASAVLVARTGLAAALMMLLIVLAASGLSAGAGIVARRAYYRYTDDATRRGRD